ncbi:MAG: flippase-like domain-containing protein [Candidatus Eisenbacteria bacterium]|uniref:Flippase-like domain-containing protein n=1 Tax=Eiseniibacteriota bacterium TaxID=2212470 RepID=A0A538TMH9_UNCEI|nr:MAG: flippase-like domain-containing protein [Candidatus Eisenbacteria bacterium]
MSRSRLILLALGIVLSALAIVLLARSIDISAAMRALSRANMGWVVAGTLVTFVGYYLRALRWREILAPRVQPSMARLFSATMVGFLAINTLPARLGELVRAYVLARTEKIPTATVLGSLAVERILDMAMLGIFWALSLLIAPIPDWFRWSGYATIGIGGAIAAALWGLHATRGHAGWSEGRLIALLPKRLGGFISKGIPAFGAGLQVFGSPKLMAKASAWSIVAWVVSASVFLLVGLSLGLRVPVGAIFLLTFVVCLGISLPSSPGFIGVMEGACVMGLSIFGVGGPEALAFAILYHVTQLVPPLVLGTYFVFKQHLTPELIHLEGGADGEVVRKKRRQ